MGITLLTTIIVFLTVVLSLVGILLFAKAKLSPGGKVKLVINGQKEVEVDAGSTILSTLGNNQIFLPSACGGGGTCAMCKCQVTEGGGEILPTEKPYFSRKEIADDWRLGCQVKIKNDMNIEIPEEIFGIKKWECEVISNYNVASFIKAFIVKLPEGEILDFEAGGYIQIDVPECEVDFKDIDIKLSNLEFDKAQVPLEQLYNKYPQNTDVLLRLSITHHYLSESAMKKSIDKENALKAFEYALKAFNIEPDNPDILKWYVITLGKTVEEDTIRNQIEQSKNIKNIALKVIDLLPDDEFCYSIMGQWHYKLADLGRASRRIASILFSEPPKGSFQEAQYFFEKSLEKNSDYIGTYYWLGKTYLKLNQEQKAIELFKFGVTLDRPFKREERAYQGMKSYLDKL